MQATGSFQRDIKLRSSISELTHDFADAVFVVSGKHQAFTQAADMSESEALLCMTIPLGCGFTGTPFNLIVILGL